MQRYLIALTLVGITDAISFMVVSPSIVFYVLQCGGSKEQYGIVLSAFSFASFCAKPFIGGLSDKVGFRFPYVTGLAVSCVGAVLYVLASSFSHSGNVSVDFEGGSSSSWPPPAVLVILISRVLMGVGAATSALGYAYVARAVPHEEQTSVNALLSMGRIGGMAIGPGFNALLGELHWELGERFVLDPLNGVGLIILFLNAAAIATVLGLLEEPKKKENEENGEGEGENNVEKKDATKTTTMEVLTAVLCADIMVPFLSIFGFNANFQLVETGFAPAASDGLGWGPVQISMVLGGLSIVVALGFAIVSALSKRRVSDEALLSGGLLLSTIAYTLLYALWKRNVHFLNYCVPVFLASLSFPFMAVPTRTIFTRAVDARPPLRKMQGTMQAALSMGASVAGFTVPALVARYCVRDSKDVAESHDGRELTAWALFAPLLSFTILLGVLYMSGGDLSGGINRDGLAEKTNGGLEKGETTSLNEDNEEGQVKPTTNTNIKNERTPLLVRRISMRTCGVRGGGDLSGKLKYDPKIAVHRHSCCEIMGISQPSIVGAHEIDSNNNK